MLDVWEEQCQPPLDSRRVAHCVLSVFLTGLPGLDRDTDGDWPAVPADHGTQTSPQRCVHHHGSAHQTGPDGRWAWTGHSSRPLHHCTRPVPASQSLLAGSRPFRGCPGCLPLDRSVSAVSTRDVLDPLAGPAEASVPPIRAFVIPRPQETRVGPTAGASGSLSLSLSRQL